MSLAGSLDKARLTLAAPPVADRRILREQHVATQQQSRQAQLEDNLRRIQEVKAHWRELTETLLALDQILAALNMSRRCRTALQKAE